MATAEPKTRPKAIAAADLPAYQEGDATCPKCRFAIGGYRFCPGDGTVVGDTGQTLVCSLGITDEHRHRACQRCGFDAATKTADQS